MDDIKRTNHERITIYTYIYMYLYICMYTYTYTKKTKMKTWVITLKETNKKQICVNSREHIVENYTQTQGIKRKTKTKKREEDTTTVMLRRIKQEKL